MTSSPKGYVPPSRARSFQTPVPTPALDSWPPWNYFRFGQINGRPIKHPATWFTQAELVFANNNTTYEDVKYAQVVKALGPIIVDGLSDILAAPPAENRYEDLKKHVLARFSDSKDQQLHKLFSGLSLGNKKPSQLYLLRDEKLRWQQPHRRQLKSQVADELVCNSSFLRTNQTFAGVSPVSSAYASPVPPHQLHNEILLQEIAALKAMITQLSTINRQLLELLKNNKGNGGARGRDRSRSGGRNQSPEAHARSYFHRKFGVNVYSWLPQTQTAEITLPTGETRLLIRDHHLKVDFLLDSRSVVSILPRPPNFSQAQREALTLYAANHSPIHTYGSWKINLNLGLRRDFQWEFTIANVAQAIMGADFLAKHGLLPDLKHKRLIDPLTGLAVQGILCDTNLHSIAIIEQLGSNDPDVASLYSFFERPRCLIGERLAAAKVAAAELHDQGVVRPSSSQWASPLHLVPKANNSWCVTGDYRRLNSITVPDRYPLPIIEDMLHESQGQVFTVSDLHKAFYQVPIASGDVKKTAVTTPFVLFEFLGTSLSLRNASQTMQRTMDQLLRKLPFVKAYIDDILVASQTFLEAGRLRGKPGEMHIWQTSGHLPGLPGFVRRLPATNSEGRSHQSSSQANYNVRTSTVPFNELLKGLPKKAKLKWTTPASQAFNKCKASVIDAACTTFLAPDAPLAFRTDASSTAIGAAQRWLDPTQAGYSTYNRELLAIYASVKHFERILEGRPFTIFTDHRPITFVAFQPATKASFNSSLVYAKGEDNVVADALSRPQDDPKTPPPKALAPAAKPIEVATTDVAPTTQLQTRVTTVGMPSIVSPAVIAQEQAHDAQLLDLLSNLFMEQPGVPAAQH
ncbi:uncharacterized protein LOC106643754 [Copidosoma floridanum]|uniref:uncharacterized protein LOC106643754 n=1 Tax=Copidosoma floridanum TaxID=29053 RepID=UPI0006C9BCD2|nr:uncharacterized protein LOC106643754 [Copidosoma floridanum]